MLFRGCMERLLTKQEVIMQPKRHSIDRVKTKRLIEHYWRSIETRQNRWEHTETINIG